MEKEIVGIYVATKQKQYFTTKEIIFLGGYCRILSEPRPLWITEEDDQESQIVDIKTSDIIEISPFVNPISCL